MADDARDAQPVGAYLFLGIAKDSMGYHPSGFAAAGGNPDETFDLINLPMRYQISSIHKKALSFSM
jgi:hypothetical protein